MNKEFIKRLTEIVEANMANEAFGTKDLAQLMGMSPLNLHRKVKFIYNKNISQFIREIRLVKAKEILLNEDLTVTETAYRVGFGNPTCFNYFFHAYFGYSPGELRKEEQWSEREIPVENTPERRRQTKIIIVLFVSLIVLIPLFVFLFYKK
jgi:AraC-like DNA-binding protein